MRKEIKGRSGQHPKDLCLMGQGSMDNYVAFLKANAVNSNEEAVPNRTYSFVTVNQDAQVDNLIASGVSFNSLDNEARVLLGILGEDAMRIYSEPISIYGENVTVYGS